MELELELSLSCSKINSGFDLNNINGNDQLYGSSRSTDDDHLRNKNKKRHIDDAFIHDSSVVPKTLPLLVWDRTTPGAAAAASDAEESNTYCDRVHVDEASSIATNNYRLLEHSGFSLSKHVPQEARLCGCDGSGGGRGRGGGMKSGSIYVKVKMEGVGIARKVDLSEHGSYQSLMRTLIAIFGYKNMKLIYQDKEGDWLLAGDVPWGIFVHTVQRLKLIKCAKD